MQLLPDVRDFLKNHRVATIATIGTDDYPYLTPIFYIVDQDRFYFVAMDKSQKVQNIKNHARVGLTVTDEETLTTLLVKGTATLVTNPTTEHMQLLTKLGNVEASASGQNFPPVMQQGSGLTQLIAVAIDFARFSRYS